MTSGLRWDIFCKVIDNYGDVGVCWRLARQLADRGQTVRLWLDDPQALQWMAPGGHPGVTALQWLQPLQAPSQLEKGDVLIEGFGCDIPPEFVERYVAWRAQDGQAARWINLEYLSAESYVERSHALPSPVMSGPGRGLNKHFFYPGFTPGTGGLLRERDLLQRQAQFQSTAWLAAQGISAPSTGPLVSLFCYEPPALPLVLNQLAAARATLLVTAGRASAAVQALNPSPALKVHYLPWLTQDDFDHLLWTCDLNFVRGEDSLVRGLWAQRPMIWHIYPQDEDAHHVKLDAFLDRMHAPSSLQSWARYWNGVPTPMPQGAITQHLVEWARHAKDARARLLAQDDLVTQLMAFVLRLGPRGDHASKNAKIQGFAE